MSVFEALRIAQASGLSDEVMRALCAACGVEFGAILPPISGSFQFTLNEAGIN